MRYKAIERKVNTLLRRVRPGKEGRARTLQQVETLLSSDLRTGRRFSVALAVLRVRTVHRRAGLRR